MTPADRGGIMDSMADILVRDVPDEVKRGLADLAWRRRESLAKVCRDALATYLHEQEEAGQ